MRKSRAVFCPQDKTTRRTAFRPLAICAVKLLSAFIPSYVRAKADSRYSIFLGAQVSVAAWHQATGSSSATGLSSFQAGSEGQRNGALSVHRRGRLQSAL